MSQCPNMNHSKINVQVRFCSMCGKVVNSRVIKKTCSPEKHAKSRKDRNRFCIDCGANLTLG